MKTLIRTWITVKKGYSAVNNVKTRCFSNGISLTPLISRQPISSPWKPVRLAYEVTEPAIKCQTELTPIVMLHGMTMSKETWEDFVQPLADATKRKVYTFDMRNHGESEWTNAWKIEVLPEDFGYFLESLGISKAIAIGHCLGGRTAMAFALSEPDKIEKMVIEDVSPKGMAYDMAVKFITYLQLLRKSLTLIPPTADMVTAKRIVSEFLDDKLLPKDSNRKDRRIYESSLPLKRTEDGYAWKTNMDVLDYCIPEMLEIIVQRLHGTYNKDTLFVCCTRSPYKVLKDEDMIREMFPRAQILPIEGATHRIHLRYPEQFLKATIDFLNKT